MGTHLLEGHRTPAQKKLIQDDVNETDDTKLAHNQEVLESWIRTQPHLPQNYDARILPLFLRGCKHNLDSVKRKLDNYFSLRNSQPEFFLHRDPHEKSVQIVLKSMIIAPLPNLSPDGCRVVYHRLSPEFDLTAVTRTIGMISDIRILQEPLIRGDIFVWDFCGMQMKHLSRLICPAAKKMLHAIQDAFPQRLQQIHLVNCSPIAEKVASFFKLFMKPKMRSRWYIHSDHAKLHEYLPLECIPKDYGGTAAPLQDIHESWTQKLYEYQDWFRQQDSVTTDESRRPADEKENRMQDPEDIKGTFRQIQLD